MMKLVQSPIQSDLAAAAADLADGVQDGLITGLAVVVELKGRRFFVDVFGSLARDPHVCRGYIASLDDCLREIAQQRRAVQTSI